MRNVLVVGHADADGHVIAEQTRRNLSRVSSFDVELVVDPERTKDHRAWTKLDAIPELEGRDIVVFVDMMFAPASFAAEAAALVVFAKAHPDTLFFVLDHHPLPLGRLSQAPNLRALYRDDVYECTLGTPSNMMVAAALCEKQDSAVKSKKTPDDIDRAEGLRRAAAPGGTLAGAKLSALLRADRWEELAQLGREDAKFHRLTRGRRSSSEPPSPMLRVLDDIANDLLASTKGANKNSHILPTAGTAMSYDIDEKDPHGSAPVPLGRTADPRDLETILTLLELAALELSPKPDSTFTLDALLREACALWGQHQTVRERRKNRIGQTFLSVKGR